MSKYLIKKTLVFGIIILFIGGIIIPSIYGNVSNMNDIKTVKTKDINNAIQNNARESHTMSNTDWWPMFRHDSGNTGSTTSVGPETNELLWKETITDEIYSAAPVIYNDRLYISTGWFYKTLELPKILDKSMFEAVDFTEILNDLITYNDEYFGGIYCLNADKGTNLWNYPLYAPNNPLIVDDKVYVTDLDLPSYDSSLYCLNAENGNLNWAKPVGGLALSPTIGADNKIFLGTLDYYSYSGSLKCFDFDGNSEWAYQLPENETIWFSAPAYCDGKVYFISVNMSSYYYYELESKLYCLNADTGEYIWSQPISTLVFYLGSSSPVCRDGKVFVVELELDYYYYNFESNLTCFNADTGSLIWKYTLGEYFLCLATPAVTQDSVFIAGFDIYSYYSWLYRISTNGALVWKVPMPGIAYFGSSSSPICSANKVFLCPWEYYGYAGEICCMEIGNGNLLWSYNLDYMTLAGASIADQRVYIADMIGNIYALGPLGEPPTSPIIDGPSKGSDGKELCWTFHSNDTDGDMIKYYIDWGDNSSNETDFNPPCVPVEVCHTYEERGEYNITAYAEDEKGLVSGVSTFKITIPRARAVYHSLFQRIFQRFPNLFTILRYILGFQ
jgi:outer membrane protein assembly factor BamB